MEIGGQGVQKSHFEMIPPAFGLLLFYSQRLPDQSGVRDIKGAFAPRKCADCNMKVILLEIWAFEDPEPYSHTIRPHYRSIAPLMQGKSYLVDRGSRIVKMAVCSATRRPTNHDPRTTLELFPIENPARPTI
jgi:hypothetical protein